MMLSDEQVSEGLRYVSTPDDCFFNVWHECEENGERAYVLPFYIDGYVEDFTITVLHNKLNILDSIEAVTKYVDDVIEDVIEKMKVQLAAQEILDRSRN